MADQPMNNKAKLAKLAKLKKSLSIRMKKQLLYGAVAFASAGLISGIIGASISATIDSDNKLTSIIQSNSNLVTSTNEGFNDKIDPRKPNPDLNKFIGDLSASYADREKGIVDLTSNQIKPFDQNKLSDAYIGANGELLTNEQAAASLLPEYKLIKKYAYGSGDKLYDSLDELKNNFWNNISENSIAYYVFKDKNGQNHYFNPLNKNDINKFKEFVINQAINGDDKFSLDYYIPYSNDKNNSTYVSLSKSSAVFSDQGNFTLSSDANLGRAFDQKINQLFNQKTNDIFSQSSFLPTISLPKTAIDVQQRSGIYLDYPTAPNYGFDKYFGIGFKDQNQDWNNVSISDKLVVNQGFSVNDLIANLQKISSPDFVSKNFDSVQLNSRYQRNNQGSIIPSTTSLDSSVSNYGLGLNQEQDNLKPLIANYESIGRNKSDTEVAKLLDKEFLKTHAYIKNRSFVTKDGVELFGKNIGLIYKGNLYGYTVHGDPYIAKDNYNGSHTNKVFIYHDTFSNNSWWLNAGNFNKDGFIQNSPYYFGFGNLENANKVYGTYPESVGISNDTLHVGADIFDLTTNRRNAAGLVADIKNPGRRWDSWASKLTFLPGYWESYRISAENRKLYLNVDVDWKLDNQAITNKEEFIRKISEKFGLNYSGNNNFAINPNSEFYKSYLSQSYINGASTYAILSGLSNFSSLNKILDENFLNVAKSQVNKFAQFYDKTVATFSLGNGRDNRFVDYVNTFNDLLQANSNLSYNSINLSSAYNTNFLTQHVFYAKDIKPVLTYGTNKQPLFEIDLSSDKKNLLIQSLGSNQNNFKQALLSTLTRLPLDQLHNSLTNLSNHYKVDGIDLSAYSYDLKYQKYLELNSNNNQVELKAEYQTNNKINLPILPKGIDQDQFATLVTDNNTWFPITYMWKFYQEALSRLSSDSITKSGDQIVTDPNNLLVLQGGINTFTELRYGKYYDITGTDINLSIDGSSDKHSLFFDSIQSRELTKYFIGQFSNKANVDNNYEIVLYYNNATNQKLGLVRGNYKNLSRLEKEAKNRALIELKPKVDENYKFYIDQNTTTKIKNTVFTLYPLKLQDGRTLYFDSLDHLKAYRG
ncbi:hypothetical protein [Mycoplasma bradburyae]|uniref:DUF31 domain-containing protein n=1 Tax=Mycoplasma bradburyae TaxID=2963128 RepID=A0AAW6HPL3_9MOLU|nr:hypothetical protein [Mycoplasma bradburyae]MDC4183171.1 hypothetical protein [Mycoplasma bradburyae]UTS70823.1 hypothetical protein NMG77_03670 [Mycoplasma bradburyae]